jgi:hypothetical protein
VQNPYRKRGKRIRGESLFNEGIEVSKKGLQIGLVSFIPVFQGVAIGEVRILCCGESTLQGGKQLIGESEGFVSQRLRLALFLVNIIVDF